MATIVELFCAILASLSLAAGAAGQVPVPAPAGEATLSGVAQLRVKRCGRDEAPLTIPFALTEDGNWSADAPVGLAGTSTSRLTYDTISQRLRVRSRLVLSGASLSALEAFLSDAASDLCGESVTVDALSVRKARLVLNKRWTHAKLRLGLRARVAVESRAHAVRYRLVAKGDWLVED